MTKNPEWEPNEVSFEISGGVLGVVISDNSARAVIAPRLPGWRPLGDFKLEVDARFTSDEWQNGLGLAFGGNDDWSEYYAFMLSFNFEQHYWTVARFKDNSTTYLTNGGWRGGTNFMASQYGWNHLTVVRRGNEIKVYCRDINTGVDKLLPGGTAVDATYGADRLVGLTVTSYEWATGQMEFDNFELTALE